jgi:hypothetical protein
MIKPLRKKHLQIWTALAILLPTGIVLSWLVIPNPVPVKIVQTVHTELLPIIKYKKDSGQYCINIRTNKENTVWQLEWKNKRALMVPSAVIYKASHELHSQPSQNSVASKGGVSRSFTPASAQLIGRIETRDNYIFPLPKDSLAANELHFILYDFIHQQIIDSINFQP